MRIVQVGCVLDPDRRDPEALLDAWPTLADVAGAVAAAGAEVTVLQAARADAALRRDGVEYRFIAEPRLARLPGTRSGAGVLPWRLARAAVVLRPDVIHLNGLGFPLHAHVLCATGAPVLVQDHADVPPRRRFALHRWGLARVAGFAFTAREQAEPFAAVGLIRAGAQLFEIPESTTRFTPGSIRKARAATGVHGDPALLWVGRLDENKDPLTVLRAFASAAPALRDPHLWCCFGDAPLLAEVRAWCIAHPELAGRVHLLGRVPHGEVESLCRAADFFLLGSRREGSGFAVIEALACGATPVLSDIPAFRALTGRGAVGALPRQGDPTAFATALLALAARPREELRRRALGHFQRELSREALGAKLLMAYGALATGKRRARRAA